MSVKTAACMTLAIAMGIGSGCGASCEAPQAAAPAQGSNVVSVADFGALPDDGKDDTEAVRAAILKCKTLKEPTLLFPKGRYEFTKAVVGKEYRILSLEGFERLTVDGCGSELIFNGMVTPFHVEKSSGVTLKRFSIDWERPPFSQGKATLVEGNVIEIEVDPAYPVGPEDKIYAMMDYDAASGLPIGSLDIFGSAFKSAELVRPQTYRLVFGERKSIPSHDEAVKTSLANLKGRTVVLRHYPELFACWGLDFTQCSGTLVEDVNIYACVGLGFHDSISKDVTCRRLKIAPRPGSGRLMSSTLDGWHSSFMSGSILIEDCVFEGMGDDGINIYSKYLSVVARANATTLYAQVGMRGWRGPTPKPGESIEISRGKDLTPYATRVVKSAQWEPDRKYFRIEFTEPLPSGCEEGEMLCNLAYSPKVTIRNCVVKGNRARGILISTPDVLVENCRVERTTHAGMMIFAEPKRQAMVPSRVTVRNNKFVDCGGSAIYVYVMGEGASLPTPGLIKGLEISGNLISESQPALWLNPKSYYHRSFYWHAGICVSSTDGAVIKGNVFEGAFSPAIALGLSANPVVEGNSSSKDAEVLASSANAGSCVFKDNSKLSLKTEKLASPLLWREMHFTGLR